MQNLHQETLATHAGYNSQKEQNGAVAVPLYLSNAFDFGTSQTAAARFALQELGPIYSRLTNPTVDVFEARVGALENAAGAISASSGSAAIFYAIANIASAGDNIIISNKIYGGSTALLGNTLKNFGISAKIFDVENPSSLESLIDAKTKAIFFESLSNPQIAVANTQEIVKIADKHGIITITDNTVATPILYQPLNHGVNVSVHSATKYICGNGAVLGGVIASAKSTNQKLANNPRYPLFNEPEANYHGLVFANLVEHFDIFTIRIKTILLRDIGASLSSFNAWQLIQGLETLSVRIKAISQSALKIAEFLSNTKGVKAVNYPGLKSSPYYEYVSKNFTDGLASGLISFELESKELANEVVNSTELFRVIVNIGDSKSIITHPASSTHSQLDADGLKNAGISAGLIRLSVGLENVDDLILDLQKAFKKAKL